MKIIKDSELKIGLFGASFETGNLGVSALAESSIKVILHKWPNAKVTLLGSGYAPKEHRLVLLNKHVCIKSIPIRFSKNILLPYHFLWFTIYGLLIKILPGSSLKKALINHNQYFKSIYEIDFAVDITAGDSFSDIYGVWRFMQGFLLKWLVIFMGKKLVFLPQTYGPFRRSTIKFLAGYILRRASVIYSRDQESLEYINKLLKNNNHTEKVKFAPDVAFVLDAHEPAHLDIGSLPAVRKEDSLVIGVNISGLLYKGGYARNDMFGLKADYAQLVSEIIEFLLKEQKTLILLIPHVFPLPQYDFISDQNACMKVYKQFSQKYQDRIFIAQGRYNHNEIKHIIGMCDFFIGSRMHSCIAAMSQYIPAVGIGYSKKFKGVFESIGMDQYVADARSLSKEKILNIIESNLRQVGQTRKELESIIPGVKDKVLNFIQLEA